MKPSKSLDIASPAPRSNGNSSNPSFRLRLLVENLVSELESLDHHQFTRAQLRRVENSNSLSFYEEVRRFEITLIKIALRRTHGNQVRAAQLLNMNATTLNAKIKQYDIREWLRPRS